MSLCGASGWTLTSPVLFTCMLSVGIMFLARWIGRQRYFPGRASFVILHLCILWWLSTAGLELAATGAECKVFWASMAWPGIVAVPTLWAVFLWQYVNSIREPLPVHRYLPLAVAPLLVWGMALSNPWHQAFYGPATGPASDLPGAPVVYEHGVLFHGAAVYVYVMMLFCLAVVSRAVITSHGLHRRHYLAFGVVTCVPWAANISYVVFGWTLFGFDPTPFSFAFTLLAFAWLILGVRLFDLLPVARHLLLEELPDPVLVIDAKGRVIEANPAALRLAGLRGGWQGRALLGWPVFGVELHTLLQAQAGGEPMLTLGEPPRYFEVRARAIERITRSGSHMLGRMVYLREVTERHRSELQLAEALALSEERLRTISSLHEQLQEQALCDPLTGLYNRRYLNEFFAREQARSLREETPIALALIDLDHFKQLNDRHGHLVGDDMLKGVAGFLECSLRSTDAVFRIGGEEFLLILPGADSDEAQQRLEAIRRELADTALATRIGELRVTLSAGLAVWPDQGQSLDELLQVADAALYEAKRSGRNQVCALARVEL
ncbi:MULTISPECIES: histidine kinase N-terminal 7TM domain-containing diguanylate cyclase [unclassified Pseudomonas]|uniref:histidine kinase N-terminal 7TM domain-containing diguanylate cyclase n=1 Tax=unclassified Pseudomonas TaxID=196821 RepID=UPI001BCF34D5|nr:histidine kinase N-terminal 7TM domain-containing protein [Pseudomonas sp. Pc102]BBP85930.1 GGDEF domain-containing protein [Pseudomonas sp. Pc102]